MPLKELLMLCAGQSRKPAPKGDVSRKRKTNLCWDCMSRGGVRQEIMSDPPTFDFSVKKIFSHRLPVDWNEQRKVLGLPEKDYAEK